MSEYPKVMRHGAIGVIVRFTASMVGTVIGTGQRSEFELGHTSRTWNMSVFKDYKPDMLSTVVVVHDRDTRRGR